MTRAIKLHIDDVPFVSEPVLRNQIYSIASSFEDQQELIGHLHDLIASQVDVVLAWKNRGYTPTNEWGSRHDLFVDAVNKFTESKNKYFKIIKEYCDS